MPPTTKIDADWLRRPETQAVFAALAAAGIEARAVGGAVRNALIGKAAADVDIATPARPEATMRAAERAGLGVVPTGLKHGTVTIMSGGVPYEVTTLRHDIETDGRHAVVAFTDDWAADAARRDFTINALYCGADGTLHDPLGGYDDLVQRRVRFIGDANARIREDYLRILRFFRFTAEYATSEPDTVGLLACSVNRDGLQRLSAERIRVELLKLLVASRAVEMVTVMVGGGYWPALLGTVPWPEHLARRAALDRERGAPSNAITRLAAIGVATTDDAVRVAARLRLSNADSDLLDATARLSAHVEADMSDHAIRVLLYREGRERSRRAVEVAEARRGGDWARVRTAFERDPIPVLPVRGHDLLGAGHKPGPAVGAVLRNLEAAWIASDFTASREALLASA